MKPFKLFLSVVCIAVAAFATAKFFSQSATEVTTSLVTENSYTPHVSVVGTVVAPSNSSQSNIPASASMGEVYVTTLISESGISDIKKGQKALVTGSGFKGKSYDATVTKIGDKAQKNSALSSKAVAVEVTLKIDKPDAALKSGFTAKAQIFTDAPSKKTVVPYAAVMQDNDGEYVFVCENEKAVKKYIKTGLELENGYEVIQGLNAGDNVVTSPKAIKNNGQKISTTEGAK